MLGAKVSIRNKTRKPDGHYVACDHYANGIGDNIALVQHINGSQFVDAVYMLRGGAVGIMQFKPQPPHKPPVLPKAAAIDQINGRLYLEKRGISSEAIVNAERAGLVKYCKGAVLFVGYDNDGAVQNVTRRAITANDEKPKRDLSGTLKYHAQMLRSNDSNMVWIVEGGIDALAIHDLAIKQHKPVPTVIISGGAGVRSFLDNPAIIEILQKADRITLAYDNESTPEKQLKTDADHNRQAETIEMITGVKPSVYRPKQGYKDIAEYNNDYIAPKVVKENTILSSAVRMRM